MEGEEMGGLEMRELEGRDLEVREQEVRKCIMMRRKEIGFLGLIVDWWNWRGVERGCLGGGEWMNERDGFGGFGVRR